MLARLDEVGGVIESRVDWTGRYFLVRLEADADEASIEARARSILGETLRRADDETALRKLEALRRGEPWMRSGETLRLSREEARVITLRRASEATTAAGLDEERGRRLRAVLEEEVAQAFERIHASGDPARRFGAEWASVVQHVSEKARAFLTEGQAAQVTESLAAFAR